jgi:hypothetical protein
LEIACSIELEAAGHYRRALREQSRPPQNSGALARLWAEATFFVPGWTAEKYVDRIQAVLRDGHEVGHHRCLHEWIDPDFPEQEKEALEKGVHGEFIKSCGNRCVRYSPLLCFCQRYEANIGDPGPPESA